MNPYGPNYRRLRPQALAANDGLCRFCGLAPSAEAHHGQRVYPPDADLRLDQLTGLCPDCHALATSLRKWSWRFDAPPAAVVAVLREAMGSRAFVEALRERQGGQLGRPVEGPVEAPERQRALPSRAARDVSAPRVEAAGVRALPTRARRRVSVPRTPVERQRRL